MRKPEFLSPTGISIWATDPVDYYLKYLSDNRPERTPQTQPMSVGSAFDAMIKNYLTSRLLKEGEVQDPNFELMTIFNAQVEPSRREWAMRAGEHCFNTYIKLGAHKDLMLQLGRALGRPRFEIDVKQTIHMNQGDTGVPFNGKPDCFLITEENAHVILDWKVSGFCSNSGHSPMPGYVRLLEDGKLPQGHSDAVIKRHKGLFVNHGAKLEDLNKDWGRQLAIYSWLCGEDVGASFIAQIHQLVCRPDKNAKPLSLPSGDKIILPKIRIAEHTCFISREFQEATYREAEELWSRVNSDHFFGHLSKQESQDRCGQLDKRAEAMSADDFFGMASRG